MLKGNRSAELSKAIFESRVKAGKRLLKYESEFIARDCPVCDYHNRSVGTERVFGYNVATCERCLMKYVDPCPDSRHLREFYNDDLISVQNERLWSRDRSVEFTERMAVLREYDVKDNSTLVEVGSGPGQFVKYLRDNGYSNASGIDIDERLCKVAQSNGVPVSRGDLNQEPIRNSDVILCYEVIEHLVDPKRFLRNVYESTSDNEIVVITCPNTDGLDNVVVPPDINGRWLAHGLFPPYHLNGFSLKSLYYIALEIGFHVKNVSTPGKHDGEIILGQSKSFDSLKERSEEELGNIQDLIAIANGSAHMEFILSKP